MTGPMGACVVFPLSDPKRSCCQETSGEHRLSGCGSDVLTLAVSEGVPRPEVLSSQGRGSLVSPKLFELGGGQAVDVLFREIFNPDFCRPWPERH